MRSRRLVLAVSGACAGLIFIAVIVASYKHRPEAKDEKADASPAAVAATSSPPRVVPPDAGPPVDAGPVRANLDPIDAGPNACRLLYGPVQQPFTGPAALVATESGVEVVFHENGTPRLNVVPAGPPQAAGKRADVKGDAAPKGEPPRASRPACAAAGSAIFCSDAQGHLHRTVRGKSGDEVVADADPGAVVTAVSLGEHLVLGYLAVRTTSEGRTSEAFAKLDDGPPVPISESGSGATDVTFAARDGAVLAMTIDARRAMSPVHARVLSADAKSKPAKLEAGPDAVIYVGGGSEHQVRGALGIGLKGEAFGLMPISGETGFGLAMIRIESPPKIDEPWQMSLYPNGFDYAQIAATRDPGPIFVARVRPLTADPSAIKALELGKIEPQSGTFSSFGLLSPSSSVLNVAVVRDRYGALWLEYTDGGGSWLERRLCP